MANIALFDRRVEHQQTNASDRQTNATSKASQRSPSFTFESRDSRISQRSCDFSTVDRKRNVTISVGSFFTCRNRDTVTSCLFGWIFFCDRIRAEEQLQISFPRNTVSVFWPLLSPLPACETIDIYIVIYLYLCVKPRRCVSCTILTYAAAVDWNEPIVSRAGTFFQCAIDFVI